METMVLSLKNIYKILMTNDFPIYSESVIGEKHRKGQTMLRFWQNELIEEFRSQPCGKMIWRNDGKRNRYTSHLCNRSPELKLYKNYANELSAKTAAESLLNQIKRFCAFLSCQEYRHDILIRRISEMVRMCEAEDPFFTHEIAQQIRDSLEMKEPMASFGRQASLFQAAYLITILSLYAAAGEYMGGISMAVLRAEEHSLTALWENRQSQADSIGSVKYLTVRSGILQDNPLPKNSFFGREEALYDIQEMMLSGKKCLVSGIGGIGKTELVRQLIRLFSENAAFDEVAIIPYCVNIVESCARVFPDFQRRNSEESFHQILYRLTHSAADGKRVLVVVDNVTCTEAEDPDLHKLAELPCAVLITSRRTQWAGFEAYPLSVPSIPAATLIFRDNYGSALSAQDRQFLKNWMRNETIRHPLFLRQLAWTAKNRQWTMEQLRRHIEPGEAADQAVKNQVSYADQLYRQLYSRENIPAPCRSLAELFTLLPYDSYSKEFLTAVFPTLVSSEEALAEQFNTLVSGGWLDASESGYSMHALIAQCLRKKVITEQTLAPVLKCLHPWLPDMTSMDPNEQEMSRNVGAILIHVTGFLSGSLSKELLLDIIAAMSAQYPSQQTKLNYLARLEKLLRRCPGRDDTVDICCAILNGMWETGDPEIIGELYRKQRSHMTVSKELFVSFCLQGGVGISKPAINAPQLTQTLLQEVLCAGTPEQIATALFGLSSLKRGEGDHEKALEYSLQSVDLIRAYPKCSAYTRFVCIYGLSIDYLSLGRREHVKPLLDEMEVLSRELKAVDVQMYYHDVVGFYEANGGDLEAALKHQRICAELVLEYCGADANYAANISQIATTLQRLGRYEEAEAHYNQAIDLARKLDYTFGENLFSNNLAVLYLLMEQPGDALTILERVHPFFHQLGGVGLGECLKNIARAYELQGDTKNERSHLTQALPLLKTGYGPEHPRTVAAEQRLAALCALPDGN